MVSIQFLQGINTKSLARHENGQYKPFKMGFPKIEHKNPNLGIIQTRFQNQKSNFKASMKQKWLVSYKNRKPHTWVLIQVNTIHKIRCPS